MPLLAVAIIAISLTPFAIYLALKRPLVFPLGLYIMLLPYDAILGTTLTVTRLVAIACALALLFNMILTRRVLAPPRSWTGWAAFILLAALSALWTIDSVKTTLWVGQLLQLFFFFTIVAIYPAERKDVRTVGALIVGSGFLCSVLGLLTFAQGFRTQGERLSIRLNGLLLDPNHIAACLLLPIAIAIGALLETRDLRIRIVSAVATMCMVTALFLTGSRGGLIALAVMFLYVAWKTRYRLQILGLMTLAGVGSLLQPTVWARFADKGLTGGSGRLFIWNAGGLALRDHWITGAGFGAFETAYDHELLSMYQPIFQGWSRPAHNAFLSAAVEVGFVGLALFVYAWWRSWSDARGNVVIEAAIIGVATASLFLDVITLKYVWLTFSMAALVKNVADPRYLRGGRRETLLKEVRRPFSRGLTWRTRGAREPAVKIAPVLTEAP